MAWYLILLPLAAAVLALALPRGSARVRLLPLTAVLHLAGLLAALGRGGPLRPGTWLGLDPLGGWVLLVISVLFAICAWYTPA